MGSLALRVYLVDGTYELFRHYFAVPKARDAKGREVGAVRGVLASLLAMMRGGVEYKFGSGPRALQLYFMHANSRDHSVAWGIGAPDKA